jgi:outer membrane protein TolC
MKEIMTPAIPPAVADYPIDLTTALRLAEAENPLIAEARQRISEALAIQLGARSLLLPSLNIGTNFRDHTGDLQRPSGRILDLDLKSLYFGGGAGAWGTGTIQVPAVSILSPLTDAFFEPLAARQQVIRAQFDASATANNVLLEVAELHFELLAAEADLRVRRETAMQAGEVVRLTRAYAQSGQGREADAQRAESEYGLILDEVRQAEEDFAVGAARLSRRLHLDQSVRLSPIAPGIEMVTIVDPTVPLPDLIRAALQVRPEFRARSAALAAAELHHQQEVYRPLLPTVWLGFSGGVMGGNSNLTGPGLGNFGGRTDFDATVFWTLSNFGFGNLALQRQKRAEAGEAAGQQARAIAAIRSEVSAAYGEVIAARQRVAITTRQVKSSESGFREDLERIRNTVGRPLEVVNSLQLMNRARVARIRAVTDYNKAEFRLFVDLGSPPPLGYPTTGPVPEAPVASPPLPPLAGVSADTNAVDPQPLPMIVTTRPDP